MLARGVLICLTGLLLMQTWMIYRDVRYVSSGPGRTAETRSGLASGRSGEGSAVRCFHLQLEAPKAADASRSSFRVRENPSGVALREALGAGTVRYCSVDGRCYRASVARREGVPDSRFDVLLASPVDDDDPTSFPVGVAADKGYVLPPPVGEDVAKSIGKSGDKLNAKVGDKPPDTPYADAFMIFF